MGKIKGDKLRRSRSDSAFNFTRTCRCLIHNPDVASPLCSTKGKDLRRSELKWLIDNNCITSNAKWVCKGCLKFAGSKMSVLGNHNVSGNTEKEITDDINEKGDSTSFAENVDKNNNKDRFQEMLDYIKCHELNDCQKKELYSELGSRLSMPIYQDSKQCSSYKNLESIMQIDVTDFLRNRPTGLIEFLTSLVGVDISLDNSNKKKLYTLCLLIESLYYVRNNNFIGNFSFAQALIQWCIHGSKLISTINGSTSASGSVTTLRNVLKTSALNENVCPLNDVDVFFDNTQRVGKTTRVREHGVTPVNVATNVVFCQSSDPSDLQSQQSLKPVNWVKSHEDCSEKIIEKDQELFTQIFKPYQEKVIKQKIDETFQELIYDDIVDDYMDHVSYSMVLDRYPDKRVCTNCAKMCPKVSNICNHCKYECCYIDRAQCYGDVPTGLVSKAKINIGEIIPVNPNSRANVVQVMKNMGKQCEIGERRAWVRFGCDGLPYHIAKKIILNIYRCEICNQEIDTTLITLEEHSNTKHPDIENVDYKLYFDYVLLIPGAGHMEINLLRALFAMCRKICLEHLVDKLGFCSTRAKDFVLNGGDHHLTWQIFQVMFHALASELCRMFCIYCLNSGKSVSFEHFQEWKSQVKNPNIHLLYDIVFTFMLGLKCFRSGIRTNNSSYMLAGRQAVAPLMFMQRHTIYQIIICNDMAIRVSAPQEVNKYIEQNEAFSASGENFRCEGGDYVTENENRSLKNHLPPGVPTFENWVTASRCHEYLKKLRANVLQNSGIDSYGVQSSPVNVTNEIQMFRREIRKSNWLRCEDDIPLKSIDGNLLHPNLINILEVADRNYKFYLKHGKSTDATPVFITPADEERFNDCSNWTLCKLSKQTEKLLEKLDESLIEFYKSEYTRNIKRQNKAVQVKFYNEVKGLTEMLLDDMLMESVSNVVNAMQENTICNT